MKQENVYLDKLYDFNISKLLSNMMETTRLICEKSLKLKTLVDACKVEYSSNTLKTYI